MTRRRAADKLRGAEELRPVRGGAWQAQALPPDCPVRPLGMLEAETPTAVYLSGSGTVVSLTGQAHGQGNLDALFAPRVDYLKERWPRIAKSGEVDGFRAEQARADLLAAAAHRGVWNPVHSIRGAGAWRGEDGGLVLHLGDRVLTAAGERRWGEIDGYVYPAAPPMLGPDPMPQAEGDLGPAAALLTLLRTWSWRHAAIAPQLVLGWIVAAQLGGALRWRPAIWPTGDRGSGKSTLIETIGHVLGPNASLATANTTAAGIRQALGHKALPVLLDELEARDDDGSAIHQVIELLRQASSGTIGLRGGAEHRGATFTIRSMMMASSINVPPLRAQDRSRIAVLELLALAEGARAPAHAPGVLHALGRRLLRRMVDVWPQYEGRLETWRETLAAELGLDARGCDQYGTLLACADLALCDAPPDREAVQAQVAGDGGLRTMLTALRVDDVADWRRCLDHLLTAPLDAWRGGDRLTVAALIEQACGLKPGVDTDAAARALDSAGVRVVWDDGKQLLAVANQHQGLARIFNGTIWQARSGAGGGWRQTLLRAPGAGGRAGPIRFAGLHCRCVLVPLPLVLGGGED